ncbi:DNA-binding transcriptional regulator, AcrR family [Nonomuraea solani]|uniref:DNA-binding transcriptional regulator, AcrR family n=1 Tax=Nonomuraea solani TaxID=1144553 RepID=A0A1H6ET16_9ACTN|nr:TetR/AcrR family transcriptional regulator [Nonomuraea solani]SEG99844.1 DNA-binding transcriptional regulator, AcrR family [Nonomuraea solani]
MARAGLTAERVTEAAADLADEVGFDNITLSALARGFGVADASLYSHVKNLQDLRVRVAVLAARELAERLTDATAGRAGKESLTAFADAWRAFAMTRPGRYQATQMAVEPAVVAESAGHQRIMTTTYAHLSAYGLPEPDMTDAIRLLRSTYQGFFALEASGGFRHSRDPDASWAKILDALDNALRHWQASP